MGKKHSINGVRSDRELVPVSVPELPLLVEPAIHQKPNVAGLDPILRTGDILSCAQENQLDMHNSTPVLVYPRVHKSARAANGLTAVRQIIY